MNPSAAATLPRLRAGFCKDALEQSLPEKVLQFGEGIFLRGFVDWMIHGLNKQGLFGGKVVVVPPRSKGSVEKLNEQNGAYTLLMRGLRNGRVVEEQEIITSVSRGISPHSDFQGYLKCARNPNLRFIISNTTEAGIVFQPNDKATDQPPSSFPAKLTLLLLERYKSFNGDPSKGFVLLPCELIERNGDNLKKTVLQTAENWNLEKVFLEWIEKANIFANTLVDRIVTGYPREEAEELWQKAGYIDELLNTSEVFHLWVIEGPPSLADELPLQKAGFNVIFTENMKPYRDCKVRILNGAHTSTVLAAFLAGKNFVGECMEDAVISGFMKKTIHDEVIPTLSLPKQELEDFADAVFERFSNPFIKHALLSISLNSVSKYKARILPSVEEYVATKGKIPARLALGLAALIAFYRGTTIKDGALIGQRDGEEYLIKDDVPVLETFAKAWNGFDGSTAAIAELTDCTLQQQDWWGKDLREIPGLAETITANLDTILNKGMAAALEQVCHI
jgi:tagaturonate reductase